MKLRLPILLLQALISLFGVLPSLGSTSITWDENGTYNHTYAQSDKQDQSYSFSGQDQEFLFSAQTDGIFYHVPNQNGNLAFTADTSGVALTFRGNTKEGVSNTAGSVARTYEGSISFGEFSSLTFDNNSAMIGGALYSYSKGVVSFSSIEKDLVFTNNRATAGGGGAIYSIRSNITFDSIGGGVIFRNNESQGASSVGSALYTGSGLVSFSNIGGDILFEKNVDESQKAALKAGNQEGVGLLVQKVDGRVAFLDNASRAIHSSGSITMENIAGGLEFSRNQTTAGGGGAIANDAGNIAFQNISNGITFSQNVASSSGGAIFNWAADVLFTDIEGNISFDRNQAGGGGAGAAIFSCALSFDRIKGDVIFTDNSTAQTETAIYGGAVHATKMLTFSNIIGNVTLTGNKNLGSMTKGGALWGAENIMFSSISGNVTLTGNEATGSSSGSGGALYSGSTGGSSPKGTISFSEIGGAIDISHNSANGAGGAVYNTKTEFFNNSGSITLSDNSADTHGGAIYGTTFFEENQGSITLSNNVAGSNGGAVYNGVTAQNNAGALVFQNNTANGQGGAIYGNTTLVASENSISFIDNKAKNGMGAAIYATTKLYLTALGGDIVFTNNLASSTGEESMVNNPVYVGGNQYTQGIVELNVAQGRTISFDGSLRTGVNNIVRINQKGEDVATPWSGMVKFTGTNAWIIGDVAEGSSLSVIIGGGTTILEGGLSGKGSLTVASSAALYIGSAMREGSSLALLTGLENFEGTFTIEDGATLGTNLINRDETAGTWYVNRDDLNAALSADFASLVGSASVNYAYRMVGNVVVKDVELGENETLVSGTGSVIELGERQPENHLVLDGGTIDASLVSSPNLNGNIIGGTSGTLITTQDHILTYTESGEHGYDVVGVVLPSGESTPGAGIIIGSESSAEDSHVVLSGSSYTSANVQVYKGTLEIGSETTVGMDGSSGTVGVGVGDSTVQLINNGTIKNDVIVGTGSIVRGSGSYEASVFLSEGSLMYVGNSPGFNSVNVLTTSNSTTLGFFLDGTAKATFTQKGEGTYSNMTVGTLNWAADTHVLLEVGNGLLKSNQENFSLELLTYSGTGDAVAPAGQLTSDQLSLSGLTEILAPGSLKVYWDGNILRADGSVNYATASGLISPDGVRVANALWSSVRSVSNFMRTSASQLDTYHVGANNIWAGGLGDFARMSAGSSADGFDYNGGGYAVGADHAFSGQFTGGIAFGQTFGTNKASRGEADFKQTGIMGGIYTRFLQELNKTSSLALDGYAAYGNVENRGNMLLAGGERSSDRWNDAVVNLGFKASWMIKLDDSQTLTPFVGMNYEHGAQQDITMSTSAGDRSFRDGSMQSWSIPVGVTWRKIFSLNETSRLIPEVTLAYVGEVSRNTPNVTTDILGRTVKVEGADPGRNAVLANAGVRWVINNTWSTGLYYTIESRKDMTNQGVNGSVNYSF